MIAGARRLLGHGRDEALVAGVRRRDRRAFEAIYERHAAQLLTFCIYLLGSRHDAEDALQATFASAYRALLGDSRPVNLRPWLFTIARNECLSILRKRRPLVELNGEVALTGDPVKLAEVHEEMADMIGGIRELPEKQRAALVLAEVHGMSHADIGSVLGVRPEQVKAYVFQARSNLLSERHAREADCREIREELATCHGLVRTRARLRRHLRSCDGCREYASGVEHQHRQLASLLPILPSLTLRYRAIDQALGLCGSDVANYANSATMAGTAIEVAGGGVSALVVKVATGIVAVGASAGVGVSVMDTTPAPATKPAADVRSVAPRGEVAANSARTRAARHGGQVLIALGPGPQGTGGGTSASAGRNARVRGSAQEGAEREGRGERTGSVRGEITSGGGRDAVGSPGRSQQGGEGGATPLQERREAADERREERVEAREEKQRERKEGHQSSGGSGGGEVSASKPKHAHTGTEGVHEKKGGSGSGSTGSTGSTGPAEREHVHAQHPNKNRERAEKRIAERKQRLAERKRKRQQSSEAQEQTP